MSAVLDMELSEETQSLPALSFADGLYYIELTHPASEMPIRVALHGITSPQQAHEALSALGCGMAAVYPGVP